ncbi:hypothetical protein PoB_003568200 [Plakobranchus ocellatus]|uniref:Uncharacterized protein n=1 Tax=Plakobranchus ocellatus TaxID=259542 RepID=A0AAV4AQG4_9GAST|nr:hypothetical protein PoB_003568200 [Plakobranchus ocellatus]
MLIAFTEACRLVLQTVHGGGRAVHGNSKGHLRQFRGGGVVDEYMKFGVPRDIICFTKVNKQRARHMRRSASSLSRSSPSPYSRPSSNHGSSDNESNVDIYDADTELENEDPADGTNLDENVIQNGDVDLNADTEWVLNLNNFPRIPAFTGEPGIQVALADDPIPQTFTILLSLTNCFGHGTLKQIAMPGL